MFGGDIVEQFNRTNNVEIICRAHQLVMEGFRVMFNEQLVTVWSAPNYCYRCGNIAAILELDSNLEKNFKIFDAAPQVYNLILGTKRHSCQAVNSRLLFMIISFYNYILYKFFPIYQNFLNASHEFMIFKYENETPGNQ